MLIEFVTFLNNIITESWQIIDNLPIELSLWPGQSCGTVCQRQFITWAFYTLLSADLNRTFLAFVLMIDSVMPFRSGFAHGGL